MIFSIRYRFGGSRDWVYHSADTVTFDRLLVSARSPAYCLLIPIARSILV
jgi:hypothetical protein